MSKPRAIFEDAATQTRTAPRPGAARAAQEKGRRAVAIWLFVLGALVALMVLVGGATRLTESGLSITEWNPVTGALPPMSAADWALEFEKYQTTEQFRVMNPDITMGEFKTIYWWEWGHRLLGRVIGLVWAAGLVWFLIRKAVPKGYLGAVILPGLLGGAQGAIGWWMVKSGVEDGSTLLSVAPYRLAVHLTLAFVILGLLFWTGWKLLRADWQLLQARRLRYPPALKLSAALVAVLFLQLLSGALVAGNDAGRGYADWPLMNGHVLPPEAFELSPLWRNLIEGMALTQFNHRVLGYALAALAAIFYWSARKTALPGLRKWAAAAAGIIWAQMALGVVTVIHGAPFWLALAHQALATAAVIHVLRARFESAYPAASTIRGAAR